MNVLYAVRARYHDLQANKALQMYERKGKRRLETKHVVALYIQAPSLPRHECLLL